MNWAIYLSIQLHYSDLAGMLYTIYSDLIPGDSDQTGNNMICNQKVIYQRSIDYCYYE